MHGTARKRTIGTSALARVEGEGGMRVRVQDGRVVESLLEIYEPPRFFEGLLRGRLASEAPDITARICGICPVAYQMSACQAIESAFGVTVDPAVEDLRRLLYCGEWIQSHALHVYMLHAPDFLGLADAVMLAGDGQGLLQRGLRLKKAGNAVMNLVGGRSVHPVNVRLGGFYRAPTRAELLTLVDGLRRGREEALDAVAWVGGFDFPDLDLDHELVALRPDDGYPITGGRLVSTGGLDLAPAQFEEYVTEEHVAHSTALHAHLAGSDRPYLVGPLARYTLNADRLSPLAADAARAAGLGRTCRNPFRSIVVRAVEMLYAFDEALRIVERYEPPGRPFVEAVPRAAVGHGWTEAPRGLLYHRYDVAADGTILAARIVPPTSQNQRAVESDLRRFVEANLDLDTEALTWKCEQAIRNYDPCISCSTHFLDLRVERA